MSEFNEALGEVIRLKKRVKRLTYLVNRETTRLKGRVGWFSSLLNSELEKYSAEEARKMLSDLYWSDIVFTKVLLKRGNLYNYKIYPKGFELVLDISMCLLFDGF